LEPDVASAARVAWQVVHLSRASVTSLEDSTVRVGAAQTAGLIGLWTQLHTFDRGAAAVLAWSAWVVLIVSVSWLGLLVTPRRLSEFWEGLLRAHAPPSGTPVTSQQELEIASGLADAMHRQLLRYRRGLRFSITLGIAALALVALGYVVEQG
jgi:hypothetical protein